MNFIKKHKFPLVGALLAMFFLLWAIFTSTNSTAPIGFLFLPLYAAIGAFVGYSFSHFLSLYKNPKKFFSVTTLIIFSIYSFGAMKFYKFQTEENKIAMAKDASTDLSVLKAYLAENNPALIQAVAQNPTLTKEILNDLIESYRLDYAIMSAIVINPNLSFDQMRIIALPNEAEFKGKIEYQLFQTYAWSTIARRKDTPADIIHTLASKSQPEHFLILALIESPHISCAEISRFSPQSNEVLENSIQRALSARQCK